MTESKYKSKRPKWNMKTSFWSSLFIGTIVSCVIFLFSHKSIWVELELIAGMLSVFIFIFLFYVLYHGIKFDSNEKYSITWKDAGLSTMDGFSPGMGLGLTEAGAEAGPLGIVIGFILDIVVTILLSILIVVLLWVGINIVFSSIMILFFPMYFLFRRSIKFVVSKSNVCHKDFQKSFYYAVKGTLINTIWFYMIIFAGHYISRNYVG
ncbi:MAG: hypothetical protein GY730_01555 [bacterium]|nr:hypothetical protein [bacterium]